MVIIKLLGVFLILFQSSCLLASSQASKSIAERELERLDSSEREARKRVPEYHYGYTNRPHTTKESLLHISSLYALSWALYPITQPEVFREQGSFKNYKKNFGDLVFDQDEPFWNWFVHPLSGSQLYLIYRANGYNRIDSLGMSIISSTLFELTIEIYSEPASVQDLYQTPVIGSVLGLGLENLSMYLLNSGNAFGKFFGHLINPATLFWFYDGKVQIIPQAKSKNDGSLTVVVDF